MTFILSSRSNGSNMRTHILKSFTIAFMQQKKIKRKKNTKISRSMSVAAPQKNNCTIFVLSRN